MACDLAKIWKGFQATPSNSTTELLNRNQSYLCINQVLFSFRPIIVEPNSKAKETERNYLQTYKDVPSPCFSWTKFKVNQICYSSQSTLTSSLIFFYLFSLHLLLFTTMTSRNTNRCTFAANIEARTIIVFSPFEYQPTLARMGIEPDTMTSIFAVS
jgi:ABC-type multidrug transport system permease subunit